MPEQGPSVVENRTVLRGSDTPLSRRLARHLPRRLRKRLRVSYRRATAWPPTFVARRGLLRRSTPFTRDFGMSRGDPIDRAYIEDFLSRHAGVPGYAQGAIRGRVLEVGEASYAQRFGDPAAIEQLDVLDVSAHNPEATVIADLADGTGLPSDAFDCIICTQTLLLIYDVRRAVGNLHRMLAPGGSLLVTLPGISQICRPDMDVWGDHWRFTTASARRLFEEWFDPAEITVESYGNVLAASAFLYGLAAQDLGRTELEVHDPAYQVIVSVKASKSEIESGNRIP